MLNSPFASPFPVSPFPTPFLGSGPKLSENITSNPLPRELSLPRYINYLADYSGCGFWRILWPEMLINSQGKGCSTSLTAMVFDPRWYAGVKCVKIQRQATTSQKEFVRFLKQVQQEHNFKIIYEVDDIVFREEIPDYNKFKFAFDNDEIRQNCIDIMNMCDEVLVTCDYMKKLHEEKLGKKEITVIPNFVPYFWMGHDFNAREIWDKYDKNKKKPRILYTGSGAHYDVDNKNGGVDDFSHVLEAVIKTVDKYQWVFVGAFPPPLLPLVQSKKVEYHPWQSLADYPKFLRGLDPQIMIAPLQDNNFNRSKSDIKYIEACIMGVPCLVQNMETYKNAPDFLKFTTGDEMLDKIDKILKNKQAYYKNTNSFRSVGLQRILERPENIGCHLEALNTPYGSSERKYLKRWNS